MNRKTDLKKRLVSEHEAIEKVIIDYIKMVYKEYYRDPSKYEKYIAKVFKIVEEHLVPHIEFEEKKVFPTLKGYLFVDELMEEHGILFETLKNAGEKKEMTEKIQIPEKLAENIQKHLEKEREKLLPLF